MLEDRDYMRQPEYREPMFRGFRWSWTMTLLVAYAVVFVLELAAQKFFPDNNLFHGHEVMTREGFALSPGYLPLSLEGIERGYVWQLVTYQFLHAGFIHIFLNSWAIYIFGRELESVLGGRKFLALFLSSGIVGGVFQVLTALLWPSLFGGEVVGASACAFGLVAAFALLFPERELTLLLFFFIPVHLRAKTLLMISAGLAVAGIVFHDIIMPGVAHAAHLGGMAMGWFFVRYILQGHVTPLSGALRVFEKRSARRQSPAPPAQEPGDDFLESEVDPILDKISARGIQSLTTREREILESARRKMQKR